MPFKKLECGIDNLQRYSTLESCSWSSTMTCVWYNRIYSGCKHASYRVMPTYEYKCSKCLKKSSRFFRSISQVTQGVVCAHCGSSNITRIFSTFSFHSPWDSGINIPSYETMSDVDDDDPKSVERWAKGMRQDMGDSFGREYEAEISNMSDPDL